MKTALVLSGGGAKGAFQVGALTRLQEKGVEFDVVSGVSVGSLNGSMVAQNKFDELRKVWNEVNNDKVYTKYSYLRIFLRNVFGKKSLYGAEPLWRLIQQNIQLEDFKKKFYVGFTSLIDGKYYSCTPDDFATSEGIQQAIYASSLMPIIWEPTEVKLKDGNIIKDCVDGGLRNVTPLSDIIKELPDKIYLILCNTGRCEEKHPNNIIKVATRTFLDIMLSEIIDNDIKGLLRLNQLVLQAQEKGYVLVNENTRKEYKYFETVLIRPPHDIGNSIDFSKEHIASNFSLGYSLV